MGQWPFKGEKNKSRFIRLKRKILLLLLPTLFFLPQIASKIAHPKIEKLLEKKLGGRIEVKKVSLSWLGKQACKEVIWSKKNFTLVADKIVLIQKNPLRIEVEGARMDTISNMRLLRRKKDLQLQFSKIDATIEKRGISFEPTEILINEKKRVHVNGAIDFKKNKMDITLGIPPETLKKVFKQAKNLPSDFLLEIPIQTDLNGKALEKELFKYFIKNYAFFQKSVE